MESPPSTTSRATQPGNPGPDAAVPLSVEQLQDAFRGPVRAGRPHPGYPLGLLLVALATALLPLIYIGLIVAAAYVTYLHATNGYFLLRFPEDARTSCSGPPSVA